MIEEFSPESLERKIDDILFSALKSIKPSGSSDVREIVRETKVYIVQALFDACEEEDMNIYDSIISYAMVYGLRVMNCGCGVLVDDALSPLKIRHLVEYEVDRSCFVAEQTEIMFEKE